MSNPKRHHYLPQFYLEGFCNDEGGLWVYNDKDNSIKNLTPINTALITNYYTLEDEDGNKIYELEKMLAEIEGATHPVINKLSNKEQINQEEKEVLALFIALLQSRTPGSIEKLRAMTEPLMEWMVKRYTENEAFLEHIISQAEEGKGEKCPCKKELKEELSKNPPKIVLTKQAEWSTLFNSAQAIMQIYLKMNWTFLYITEKSSIITSDNPLLMYEPDIDIGPYGYGVATPTVQKYFPLTKNLALQIGDIGNKVDYKLLNDRKTVRYINESIYVRRKQFVIARDKELLEFLFERLGDYKRPIPVKFSS